MQSEAVVSRLEEMCHEVDGLRERLKLDAADSLAKKIDEVSCGITGLAIDVGYRLAKRNGAPDPLMKGDVCLARCTPPEFDDGVAEFMGGAWSTVDDLKRLKNWLEMAIKYHESI